MVSDYCIIEHSAPFHGSVSLEGSKNALLPLMLSLILVSGKSRLNNVPALQDVDQIIVLLRGLGAQVNFNKDEKVMIVDTSTISSHVVPLEIMKKTRASVLVMGPLLARFKRAEIAFPGGDAIGARPINFHINAFIRMGAEVVVTGDYISARANNLKPQRFVLDYPSVGATENIIMASVLTDGVTEIVNAALEPEVFELIAVLKKMGAEICCKIPATICITGVKDLHPIEHTVMTDRLEAGTLLLAAAVTRGAIFIPNAPVDSMELFLQKLDDMGHHITCNGESINFVAAHNSKPLSFKTMPYPGFPTDLQAPMMAALCYAQGTSVIHETVFEDRMGHVEGLRKMGAHITIRGGVATIKGVDTLYGAFVAAHDIRSSAALIVAGLRAQGTTVMHGVDHLRRGYYGLDKKLEHLGARVTIVNGDYASMTNVETLNNNVSVAV